MNRDIFWKLIAVIAIFLWIATLCTWCIIKTTPPRYIKSDTLILDIKENKFYHQTYRRWMPCVVPYAQLPHPEDIQWMYIEEITGYSDRRFRSINNNISANAIIQGLDQNKYTISELRDAMEKLSDWSLCNILMSRDCDDPVRKSEYREIIQSIGNSNIRKLFSIEAK